MATSVANPASLALFSDCDLIRLTLEGQPDCFATLMERHLGAIRRCIGFMLRGNAAADDLAQEVVLKALQFLSGFRAQSSFRTWLTRVAVNEVRQYQRRELRASRFQEVSNPDLQASRDASPYEHFVRMQGMETVRTVLKSIPDRYREVVILRELGELSILEIAERLRCTIPTVKTRLFRARRMLVAGVHKSHPPASIGMPNKSTPRVRPCDTEPRPQGSVNYMG
jgi:RNA polymerase sigma-70 factor (ECF subfamily)